MKKLSAGDKFGYGSAAIGDAAAYTFICSFLLFFLTTVAGIQPAIAGTITVVSSIWNAILNPVFGYLSDHSRSRMGRRRAYMFGFAIPLFFVIILLFTTLDISYWLRVIYYCLMTLAFWTCYTGFFIPYYALGAEYTDDYNERTVLRSYVSFFNIVGVCFSLTAPTIIVKEFTDVGLSERLAWMATALLISSISLVSILITVKTSKAKDMPLVADGNDDGQEASGLSILMMFREYLEVLKMKPIKIALTVCLLYLIGYTIIMSDMMYFLTFNMGYSGAQVSLSLLCRSLMGMMLLPLAIYLCKITDKRTALIIIFFVGIAGISVMRPIGVSGIMTLGLLLLMTAVCTSSYWQIMPSIVYDICEYDEYINYKRREGAIVSIQGLVESIAAGIGSQILGIILQIVGFDGEAAVQSAAVERWIFNCVTIIPALLIAAAAVVMFFYPITRGVFEDIKQKLKDRVSE